MLDFETWNSLMDRFLGELSAAFPSRRAAIGVVRGGMSASTLLDDSTPCKLFVSELRPHARAVADRNGSFFGTIGEVAGVELADMYAEADSATRETIFEYLETLLTLGNHLVTHP